MSRKQKKPRRPPPPQVEVLDASTTDTSFMWPSAEPPTETMRMVAEVASARDREWFDANPQAAYRVRWSLPGEFPAEGMESLTGRPMSIRDGRWVTVVVQVAQGVRQRSPLLFMDGGITGEPIPDEVWPDMYAAAVAPDREAAVRALAARMMG